MDLIQLYSPMDKRDLEKHSRCSDLIGMIIWAIKTQWVVLEALLTLKEAVAIHFSLINSNSVSYLDLLSIFSMVSHKCKLDQIRASQFTAHFYRYTTRSYLIYFKIKNLAKLSILEKTSTQGYSSRVRASM